MMSQEPNEGALATIAVRSAIAKGRAVTAATPGAKVLEVLDAETREPIANVTSAWIANSIVMTYHEETTPEGIRRTKYRSEARAFIMRNAVTGEEWRSLLLPVQEKTKRNLQGRPVKGLKS